MALVASINLPSTWFDREVSENTMLTRWTWRALQWIEINHPKTAARLGCYVTILVQRSAH